MRCARRMHESKRMQKGGIKRGAIRACQNGYNKQKSVPMLFSKRLPPQCCSGQCPCQAAPTEGQPWCSLEPILQASDHKFVHQTGIALNRIGLDAWRRYPSCVAWSQALGVFALIRDSTGCSSPSLHLANSLVVGMFQLRAPSPWYMVSLGSASRRLHTHDDERPCSHL